MQTIIAYARTAAHIASGFAALSIVLGLFWFRGDSGAAFWMEAGAGIAGLMLAMLWIVSGITRGILWMVSVAAICAYGVSRLGSVAEFGASSIFLPAVLLVSGLVLGMLYAPRR